MTGNETAPWIEALFPPGGADLFSATDLLLAMVTAALLSFVLSAVYRHTHRGTSYSQSLLVTMVLMAVATSVVMLIIGSNIARAFSLVGALSIIRFRTAVKDPKDTENAQLVCNLSYTMSIARIAHYVKCIMRDNIGSTADAPYIQNQLDNWIGRYVTTVVNPDDRTLKYFPFKSASVNVVEQPGQIGFYSCQIGILPHIQFEGMDVELKLDSRL